MIKDDVSMYYFVINPKSKSGRGLKIWTLVKNRLDELKISYRFYLTKHKAHATKIAADLCEHEPGTIDLVVLGGDGTINEVLNGITDFTRVCLSYIPTGSSNDFARSLKISGKPLESLATVLAPGKQTTVDIGELELLDDLGNVTDTKRFAVSCGIGYDAAICYEALNSKLKNFLNALGLGKLTYGLIAAKQIICYKPTSASLIVDGKPKGSFQRIIFLVNMIHAYEGGGAKLVPTANYQDHKLSICFVHNMSRFKVLFLLPTAFFAKHTHFKGVTIFDCDTLEMLQESPRVTHTDGEFGGNNKHIRVSCNRLTLTVNTPI